MQTFIEKQCLAVNKLVYVRLEKEKGPTPAGSEWDWQVCACRALMQLTPAAHTRSSHTQLTPAAHTRSSRTQLTHAAHDTQLTHAQLTTRSSPHAAHHAQCMELRAKRAAERARTTIAGMHRKLGLHAERMQSGRPDQCPLPSLLGAPLSLG